MTGTITFYFNNGFTIKKQIGSDCKNIQVKGLHPINFILDIDKQSISSNSIEEELIKLNKWVEELLTITLKLNS